MKSIAFLERGKSLPRTKGQCRVCDLPLPSHRRGFCTDECRDLYYVATSTDFLRFKVFERDHGICAACEQDCDVLEQRTWGFSTMQKLPRKKQHRDALTRHHSQRTEMVKALITNGYARLVSNHPRTLWEADHIVPLTDGGTFGLDNLQTLCQPCHIEKTADEARWRTKRRKVLGVKTTATNKWLKRVKS